MAISLYPVDWPLAIFKVLTGEHLRALAEGNSIRATARIVQVDKDAMCPWLDRAAQHCRLVMLYLWRNLHVIVCQLDELWSFVHTKHH